MSRYTGPKFKISRRLGVSLSGTGKELERKPYAPGQAGNNPKRRAKISEYGTQLREKQKLRFTYGMSERQFSSLFKKAGKIRQGTHGTNFLITLESRVDSLVYRMGFASTRYQARQLVNHGHFTVNGVRVTIPSYLAKPGDVIAVREKSKKIVPIVSSLENSVATLPFVSVNKETMTGTFERFPERNEINPEINESLIVEYYNRLG